MVERGRANFYKLTNNSGVTLTRGLVVVPDLTMDLAVTLPVEVAGKAVFASVHDLEIADGEDGLFQIHGAIAPYLVANGALARGEYVYHDANGKLGDGGEIADETTDPPDGTFGFTLKAAAAPDDVVPCYVGAGSASGAGVAPPQLRGTTRWQTLDTAVADDTDVAIPWDVTFLIDNGGIVWAGGNPTRLTVDTGFGGNWYVDATLLWDSTTGGRRSLTIRKNGTTDLARANLAVAGADEEQHCGAWMALADGDYIELIARQTSGGPIDAKSADFHAPVLSVARY